MRHERGRVLTAISSSHSSMSYKSVYSRLICTKEVKTYKMAEFAGTWDLIESKDARNFTKLALASKY